MHVLIPPPDAQPAKSTSDLPAAIVAWVERNLINLPPLRIEVAERIARALLN